VVYTPKHIFDALPSSPDPRDLRPRAVNTAALPPVVALPPVAVMDQSNEGSCVGHGCAGARETLEAVAKGVATVVPLSRAFLYYEARKYEHSARFDSGAEVRDGCKALNKIGVCPEVTFPYVVGGFAKAPSAAAVKAAAAYRISAYARLAGPNEARAVLAQNKPVVIGVSVFQSFEAVGADGMVPIPLPGEQLLGGHCVFLSGYHPDPANPGMFIFDGQNSWGVGWGDRGRFHIPEGYLANGNLCSDLWSLSL
jgi:C1A family cysteine protease